MRGVGTHGGAYPCWDPRSLKPPTAITPRAECACPLFVDCDAAYRIYPASIITYLRGYIVLGTTRTWLARRPRISPIPYCSTLQGGRYVSVPSVQKQKGSNKKCFDSCPCKVHYLMLDLSSMCETAHCPERLLSGNVRQRVNPFMVSLVLAGYGSSSKMLELQSVVKEKIETSQLLSVLSLHIGPVSVSRSDVRN